METVLCSHYFKRHRDRYYDLLQAVRDTGDWEGWLKFFLEAVGQVSEEATKTARRVVALRKSHRTKIAEKFGRATGNGLKVLEHLYSHPIVSVNDIAALTRVSFTAANKLMSRLVENGILTEATGQARNRRFRYCEYIELFSD